MTGFFDFQCISSDPCKCSPVLPELAAWVVVGIFAYFLFVVGSALSQKVT